MDNDDRITAQIEGFEYEIHLFCASHIEKFYCESFIYLDDINMFKFKNIKGTNSNIDDITDFMLVAREDFKFMRVYELNKED